MLRIDKIMKLHDVSTQELASRMQVTPQYVSEVVNGRKNITISGLKRFANALQVPLAALFDGYHEQLDKDKEIFNCPYCGNVITVNRLE